MSENPLPIIAVVPAAGVGSRMQADRPKQYLTLHGKTLLEHTVEQLLAHPRVTRVVVAISDGDPYFDALAIAKHPRVVKAPGGRERADSVLAALKVINDPKALALVHDAARPNITHQDIDNLIAVVESKGVGAILAAAVKDTMKRTDEHKAIIQTVERAQLWHALTPQLFNAGELAAAIDSALKRGASITDEASAMEFAGVQPQIVAGRSDNIKVTNPEDLDLIAYYLSKSKSSS